MQAAADIEFEPSRIFLDEAQSVLFFGHQGERMLRCYVTRKALECYCGASDDGDAADCLQAFDDHAGLVHDVAAGMFRGQPAPAGNAVVVTSSEMFWHLVRHRLPAAIPGTGRAGLRHG